MKKTKTSNERKVSCFLERISELPRGEKVQIERILHSHYGNDVVVQLSQGALDFSLQGKNLVRNIGPELSYDDYLEIQIRSWGKIRADFEYCYFVNGLTFFKGTITRKTAAYICFGHILIHGFRMDGSGFFGKEDHVWMNINGFEQYQIGDSLQFQAEVYRYVKTGKGKIMDYGLINPYEIYKVDKYELPMEQALEEERIEEILCENCLYREQCFGICIFSKEEIEERKEQIFWDQLQYEVNHPYIIKAKASWDRHEFEIFQSFVSRPIAHDLLWWIRLF